MSLSANGIRWPTTLDAIEVTGGRFIPYGTKEWDRYGRSVANIGNTIIVQNGPDRVAFWARLPMIVVAALLAFLVYVWGSGMVGKPAALAALFLYVVDPTILGHSGLVTTDVGFAGFTMLFFFALWLYVCSPTWKRLLLAGAAMGLALGTKFSAVALPPICALLLFAAAGWHCGADTKASAAGQKLPTRRRSRFAKSAGAFGLIVLVAFCVIEAIYFFPSDPLLYMRGFQQLRANRDAAFQVLLGGHLHPQRVYSYFAIAYLLKEPIANIVLAVIGLTVLLRSKAITSLQKLFLLMPPAIFFIGYSLQAENTGVRYVIPVLPFAFISGGVGLTRLTINGLPWQRVAGLFLCVWLVVSAVGIYPDHMSYFNEAACLLKDPRQIGFDGGSRCGPLWLDDSNVDWGQGMKELKVWLNQNAPTQTVRLLEPFGVSPDSYGVSYDTVQESEILADTPQPALYVISAHFVARIPALADKLLPGKHLWLRDLLPTAVVGHSLYVYDFSGGRK